MPNKIETKGCDKLKTDNSRQGRGTGGPGLPQNVFEFYLNNNCTSFNHGLVERSFSTLKKLKTYLRSKTGEERLTALALMTQGHKC